MFFLQESKKIVVVTEKVRYSPKNSKIPSKIDQSNPLVKIIQFPEKNFTFYVIFEISKIL